MGLLSKLCFWRKNKKPSRLAEPIPVSDAVTREQVDRVHQNALTIK